MAIVVTHTKVSTIPDGDDSSLIRPSDWNDNHTLTGLGSMAEQNANAVAITGGTISGVAITGYIPTSEKAQPLGVATLDASGKVPTSQIPLQGDLNYQGTWNATTNTPTLTSSVGTKGHYYVVDVAGTTNLNGITDWQIGDWAIFNGSVWQKVDNTDAVTSVNGFTGTVVLTTTNIAEGTNLYYTDARARASNSAGTGISYDNSTGVITNSAPDQVVALTGAGTTAVTGTYPNFTITSNDAYVGTVTSVGGTGTINGLTLTGTVTSTGNLTLGGTLDLSAPPAIGETTPAAGHFTNLSLTGTFKADNAEGTSGQVLTSNGAGNTPKWTTPTTGTVTSVTGTAPVVSSGGATPAISMAAATGSVNGYLTSTDWTTFNGKYSVGGALGTPSSGTVTNLTGTASININGTVGATTANTGVFTTATANSFIPNSATVPTNGMYLATTNTVGFSTNSSERMRIDATGNTGIGTSSPSSFGILATAGNVSNAASALGAADASVVSILNNSVLGLNTKASISMNIASLGKAVITGYYAAFNAGGDIGVGMQFGTQTNAAGGTVERMRINQLGNVGIGTTAPSASAILDVQSTTKGVRMPNMTTVQKNAISSPAAGLMVFDTTLSKLCVYSGIAWETITSI